jgi:predicted ArsR family transcriptional regulator
MTEHVLLQQLFILRQDIESTPMLDPFAAQQRDRWAARLGDLMNRRMATQDSVKTLFDLTTDHPAVINCMGSVPECAANGCQFRKTAGYRPGEGPVRP